MHAHWGVGKSAEGYFTKMEAKGSNLIFLISQPRAGSTLLQLILSGHQDIATTSEPWIALHPLFVLREKGIEAVFDSNLYRQAVSDFLKQSGVDETFYRQKVAEFLSSFYNQAVEFQKKKIFLDKTPRYYHIINELIEIFPGAKFIILFRNPLAVLSSILKTWSKDDLTILGDYKDDLIMAPRVMADFITKYPERCFHLKYEDLVEKPDVVTKEICSYLGLEYSVNMLEYANRVPGDWKFGDPVGIYKASRPTLESLARWKDGFETAQKRILALSYIKTLGPSLLSDIGYDYQELESVIAVHKEEVQTNLISWDTITNETLKFPTTKLMRELLYRILSNDNVWQNTSLGNYDANIDSEWRDLLRLTAKRFDDLTIKHLISERDSLKNSLSWKITKPLRIMRRIIVRLSRLFRKYLAPGIGNLGNGNKSRPLRLSSVNKFSTITLKNYPIISIVTPSYNQAGFLENTIKSVVTQRYPNIEYIVMDGGSKDGSEQIIRRYNQHLAYWVSEKDKGQTNALNQGFIRSSGEIMAYLNSDDLLLPGSLQYVAIYFLEHPDVDVIYGHRILINENGDEIGRWILPNHSDEVIKLVDYVPQETLFWRRSIWEKAGGCFDESFHYAMDWDLIVRFISNGARIVRVPVFIGAFRVHDKQKTTASLEVGTTEVERIRMRTFGNLPSRKEIRKKTRLYFIEARFREIMWYLRIVNYNL